MKLLSKKKEIKNDRKLKKKVFFFLNRKKNTLKKWVLKNYIGHFGFIKKTYVKLKKNRFSFQRNHNKKNFILKRLVKLFSSYSFFNLIFLIKGRQSFVETKKSLDLLEDHNLNFSFWFVKKKWIREILKKNSNLKEIESVFNGTLLIIKCESLKSMLETFLVFNQKNMFCASLFLYKKFFWTDTFFNPVIKIRTTLNHIEKSISLINFQLLYKISLMFSNLCSRLILYIK